MAQPNLKIRPATPTDVGILLPLIHSAYRGEESRQGWTTEADLLVGDRIDSAGLLAKITDPDGVVLLATAVDESSSNDDINKNTTLIACCELLRRPDRGPGYFGLFAVDPRRQGGGVGKAVLQNAERYARESLGITRLEMSVIWTREELIAWYVRRGYARTGEQRPFPFAELTNGRALRDDLYFEILEKDLVGGTEVIVATA